jgi:CHASE3 domain sensor protein
MEFVTLCLGLVVPHLPALLNKAAETVVGEGAKKAAFEAVPAGVKALWAKLLPKVETNTIAQGAAAAVAADPTDEDSATMLKLALKKVLQEIEQSEPELLAQLRALMEEEKTAEAGGNSATVMAGTIYSSVVGDGATVTQTIGVPPGT